MVNVAEGSSLAANRGQAPSPDTIRATLECGAKALEEAHQLLSGIEGTLGRDPPLPVLRIWMVPPSLGAFLTSPISTVAVPSRWCPGCRRSQRLSADPAVARLLFGGRVIFLAPGGFSARRRLTKG